MRNRRRGMQKRFTSEEKGLVFLLIIFLIIISVTVILVINLKTDVVGTEVMNDQVLRTLFVIEDDTLGEKEKNTVLFSSTLVYYPVSKKALAINIPGNVGGIYQSLGRVDRIDDVYKEKGMSSFKKEVEGLLGVKIPFTVGLKLSDFTKMVDYLGGLRIFIPSPINVKTEEGMHYLLPSGAVTLDGDKVLTYLKYRLEDESYLDVQERYQNTFLSFLVRVHETRSTFFTKKSVFREFAKLEKTNIHNFDDVYNLFSMLSEMDGESIVRQTITGRFRVVDREPLLFPMNNGDFIKEAVKQSTNMLISNTGTLSSRVYVLEIKNGTQIQGLAHNTAILFQNASYDVLSTTNADSYYDKTVIIDHIGNEEMAKMVGDFIHCTNIKEEEIDLSAIANEAPDVDFTVILGRDFDGRYVR